MQKSAILDNVVLNLNFLFFFLIKMFSSCGIISSALRRERNLNSVVLTLPRVSRESLLPGIWKQARLPADFPGIDKASLPGQTQGPEGRFWVVWRKPFFPTKTYLVKGVLIRKELSHSCAIFIFKLLKHIFMYSIY